MNDAAGKLRIVPPACMNAGENMATDETLFLCLRRGLTESFIRFYRWNPFALSFGYFQNIEPILDLDTLRKNGMEAVRRMSGGKMVFHADEWTFAGGFPLKIWKSPPTGKRKTLAELFRHLMEPFLQYFQSLGLEAKFSTPGETAHPGKDKIHCYASAAGHSVFLEGKKLIGAAAIVKEGFISFHGSIPISHVPLPNGILKTTTETLSAESIACLAHHLDADAIARLPQEIPSFFSRAFGLVSIERNLTARETEISLYLQKKKYKNLHWPKTAPELIEKDLTQFFSSPG